MFSELAKEKSGHLLDKASRLDATNKGKCASCICYPENSPFPKRQLILARTITQW
jgi:hypothetical protein